jgi:hypothetical protein
MNPCKVAKKMLIARAATATARSARGAARRLPARRRSARPATGTSVMTRTAA